MKALLPYACGVGILLLFTLAATTSTLAAVAVVVLAGFMVAVICSGTSQVGTACIWMAFATAPMYKGLAIGTGPATPTDLLLVVGFALLFPKMLGVRVRLAPAYIGGIAFISLNGVISSALSSAQLSSFVALLFWLAAMAALPMGLAYWAPPNRTIDRLVWAYVLGQMFSVAWGLAHGPVTEGRYMGLTIHPNYFGEAGMLSFALCLHLLHRTPSARRWLVWAAMSVSGLSVLLSGSRAATAVVAVLVLMVPFIERSAAVGYVVASLVALGGVLMSTLLRGSSDATSLGRLAGGGSAQGSDTQRAEGLRAGLDAIVHNPLFGRGLIDLFDVHNNFLEVGASIGVLGLAAFLLVLWSLARGLFGHHEMRRLCYCVWAYIGFGATIPSLYDRSIWVVVALAIVVSARSQDEAADRPDRRALLRTPGQQRLNVPDPKPYDGQAPATPLEGTP